MVSGQLGRCYNQCILMRSDDYGSWFSYLGRGMRAFFSAQGPGRSSKCSAEVLDRQLVSAVLRFLSWVVLYARMHELQLSTYHFTLCDIGTGFYSNAQAPYATAGCANVSTVLLVDNTCKKSACCKAARVSSNVLRVFVSLCTWSCKRRRSWASL